MNTSHIKAYAPKARTDFIAAISKQAAKYGITENKIESLEIKGDLAVIGGKPFPLAIVKPREALISKIQLTGYNQVIEQVAYSWFNRLCAIRYMELADYLGHGRRVLSHPQQANGYQILEECLDIDLPGLDQAKVRALKIDGSKDEELYRMLLLAQCHALHAAMPFLFELVDDETELLLPENLTKTDSLIRDLVTSIPEEDWANIEIIGWLYQFYISEKKDQVIGKVVKSEDIPAATQLFTPNWIVKYMVQNSLGAQWLATYPQSPLKGQMDYYIEPAEQTDEVNAQLASITPSQLNPEELTLIDPASGSGHILVEAYELFKAIYLERGYRQRDVPQLILEKNLFGLDIDERAAQLTGFALMMKGRADDRRLFERGVKLNVMALMDSAGFDAEALASLLPRHSRAGGNPDEQVQQSDLEDLKRLFEHATTFGSLIQVPEGLASSLPTLKQLSEATSQDLFVSEAIKRLAPLVQQAEFLAAQYDAVVANPPYMGGGFMCKPLKAFVASEYKPGKGDLFSCFINRGAIFSVPGGNFSFVTMHTWMFLRDFESFRSQLVSANIVRSLAHLGNGVMGIAFATAATNFTRIESKDYIGTYSVVQRQDVLRGTDHLLDGVPVFTRPLRHFDLIPGQVLAYSLNDSQVSLFEEHSPLSDFVVAREGLTTADNERFLRFFWEVDVTMMGKEAADSLGLPRGKWFPYQKGGPAKRWFGNNEWVIDWENDGNAVRNNADKNTGRIRSHNYNGEYAFRQGITWSAFTNAGLSFRHVPKGYLFDTTGSMAFPEDGLFSYLGLLNSKAASELMGIISPSPRVKIESLLALPDVSDSCLESEVISKRCVEIAYDIDCWSEISPYFNNYGLLSTRQAYTLDSSYTAWITQNKGTIAEMKRLEEENNRLFIEAYELQDELPPDVPIEQITLTVNPAYRYGGKLTKDELWNHFREDTMQELVSYAIGCMMGRYSLDEPGLIYAHSGSEGFDPSRYPTFLADDDAIVPLTDIEWFDDDAANRLFEFISVAWDKVQLEQNLNFLADNLSPKRGEGSRDTIRRYLSNQFFKDHCQTYKKRPIYWLFSSGKEKAFQCLVYLHRYNEGTLARMRTEYVIPLTAKLSTHVQKLEKDVEASSTTAEIKKLEKEIARLHKQQAELSSFDEKLRHYADQRIHLNLDDGVKVNYGKFGDLLAEVKAITGEKPKEDF